MTPLRIVCLIFVFAVFISCGNDEPDMEYPISTDFQGKFVFGKSAGGGTELFTISAAGTSQLTSNCTGAYCHKEEAEWIYPGNRILYYYTEFQNSHGFFIMNADGSDDHPVIDIPRSGTQSETHVSDDGSKFAFVHEDQVIIYALNAQDSLEIIDSVSWVSPGSILFSPDGNKILVYDVSSFRPLTMGMHSIGIPGMTLFSMENDLYGPQPSFSYDGEKIVYKSDSDIFIMDADGSNQIQITNSENRVESYPVCSPVDNSFVFTRGNPKNLNGPSELILYNLNTNIETVILSSASISLISSKQWSPDGQQIAFFNYSEPNEGIFIINRDGTDLKRVLDLPYGSVEWSLN